MVKMIVFDEKDLTDENGVLNDWSAGNYLYNVVSVLPGSDGGFFEKGFMKGYLFGIMWMHDLFLKMLRGHLSEDKVYAAYKKTLEQLLRLTETTNKKEDE